MSGGSEYSRLSSGADRIPSHSCIHISRAGCSTTVRGTKRTSSETLTSAPPPAPPPPKQTNAWPLSTLDPYRRTLPSLPFLGTSTTTNTCTILLSPLPSRYNDPSSRTATGSCCLSIGRSPLLGARGHHQLGHPSAFSSTHRFASGKQTEHAISPLAPATARSVYCPAFKTCRRTPPSPAFSR